MSETERLFACRACGDPLHGAAARGESKDVAKMLREYCRACAEEKLGISVMHVGTLQHGTGGGRRVIKETKTH